ncbi:MAG: deoxyribonuclease V [Ktedonobacterales bacterium]
MMPDQPEAITHPWDVTPAEAIAIQRRLAPLALQAPSVTLADIHTVAGVDASYTDIGRAAIVVFTFPELVEIERVTATHSSVFPYVPGLLSFREVPVALDALAKLTRPPDLLICDGQGYAHPRRFGLACHLGLLANIPAIGCAKSRLIGKYTEPGPDKGDSSPLLDHGERIGVVLRSKPRTNPLFISRGYKTDLETAVAVVLACLRGYRLPETTRAADKLAGER